MLLKIFKYIICSFVVILTVIFLNHIFSAIQVQAQTSILISAQAEIGTEAKTEIKTKVQTEDTDKEIIIDFRVKRENLPSIIESDNEKRIPIKALKEDSILTIESSHNSFFIEDKIRLSIIVDPGEQSINTVSTVLRYPQEKLNLLTIDNANSHFSLFLEEEINQEEGLVIITCLQPFPGIKEKANLVNLIFQPLETGEIEIEFLEDSIVLANDGYGTNVLKETINGQYLIE